MRGPSIKCSHYLNSGDQSQIREENPPGVLHLCLLHQPDSDDVPHYRWHSCLEQVSGRENLFSYFNLLLSSLVADLSPELAAMLLASVIGGYTLIGGLGATFYVSYFNTALIFVLILMLVVEVGL